MEPEELRRLSKKFGDACPSDIVELHTEALIDIQKGVDSLMDKVDKLGIVEIKNGNADGTPTQYKRNDFFQMIYDRTSGKKRLEKAGKFIILIKPVVIAILVIIWIYANFIQTKDVQNNSQRIDKILNKIELIK